MNVLPLDVAQQVVLPPVEDRVDAAVVAEAIAGGACLIGDTWLLAIMRKIR